MRRTLATGLALLLLAGPAVAAVKTETVTYEHDGVTLKGHLAYDDAATGKRPGVLVVHEWWGLDEYAKKRAEMLAGMGYVALAADMYGNGKSTEHPKEAGAMAGEVRKNVKAWMGRANAGLDVLRKNDRVDPKKLAAMGYCFGGSTALQLAHTGADVAAVVSFHGAIPAIDEAGLSGVKAKILICHGAEDDFIPEAVLTKLRETYRKAGVDYQMVYYGRAVHSFTVPGAEKRGMKGIAYQEEADKRSWAAMKQLFDETFGAGK